MPNYYEQTMSRYSWIEKQDIIRAEVSEDVTERCLVARKLDDNTIVRYDTDDTVGDNVSAANYKPLGVIVYDSYASGEEANIAIRGTFGAIGVHLDAHVDTPTLDDTGGVAGGKLLTWTMSHKPLPTSTLHTETVVVESKANGDDFAEVDSSKYTVATVSGTTSITFGAADDVPADNGAIQITYMAIPNTTDRVRFEPGIAIQTVETIKREV